MKEKSRKKHKILPIVIISIFLIIVLAIALFMMHMKIEPTPHVDCMEYETSLSDFDPVKGSGSVVYMTSDISPEGIKAVYDILGRKPEGRVAVKLSTGEAGNDNHLSPDLIKDLVHEVNGTIIECNTAYGGSRTETEMHRQVAADHGFTAIAEVDIMDAEGSMTIPVNSGKHLKNNIVGKDLANYDFVMVLSHFKGHPMAGYGGALKNISIGIASPAGKEQIHTANFRRTGKNINLSVITNQNDFLESMAEAAKSVSDYEGSGERMLYISVMNNMSVDCDCVSEPAAVDMKDIGILASFDPVALDQACLDLVFRAEDGTSLQNRIESKNGYHILPYAEEIGLGSRSYRLVHIDR